MHRQVTQCPICDSPLRITELSCMSCDTRLHGKFPDAPLARLPAEHQRFIETFVRCRGVIRDIERALGVSYPTVRARLDAVVLALEEAFADESRQSIATNLSEKAANRDARRSDLLRQVQAGTLDAVAAAEALRSL